MEEDDFIKRGLQAYVFVTAALWFMSWAMAGNSTANESNPAWQLIWWLRTIFDWAGLIGTGLWITTGISHVISDHLEANAEKAREEDRQKRAIIDAEEAKVRAQEQKRIDDLRRAQEERERAEEYRKRLREKQIQKQQRTTQEAANAVLSDF